MYVACVLVDHLPFKLESQRDPSLGTRQVVIFRRHGSQREVLDMSPGIPHLDSGMPLQEALARCKDTVPIEADMPCYQEAFDQILLRLGNWSPVVEAAGLGCAYVGLDGLEDTYGSEERLVNLLLQAVPRHWEPRLGVGHGKFPAYLAALRAAPGRAYKTPLQGREFLASFPVEVLPVSWGVKERLRSFGLDTLGKLADLSLGPLQAQFGPVGAMAWRLAQGVDHTPLDPQRPEEKVTASLAFSTPTVSLEPMLLAVEHLLGKLFARPEMRSRCARIALLEGHAPNSPAWQRRIVFKTPVSSRHSAYVVLKGALANITLPGPLEELRLTLKELTGEVGWQESLFQDVRQRQRLRQAIGQLKASQGRNPIYQVREVEPWSRIPERRRALVTYEP